MLKLPDTKTIRRSGVTRDRICSTASRCRWVTTWPAFSSLPLPLSRAQRHQIVGHGMIAGVHHFVVHRKHEHVVEIALHGLPEFGQALAVHVAGAAGRRRVNL